MKEIGLAAGSFLLALVPITSAAAQTAPSIEPNAETPSPARNQSEAAETSINDIVVTAQRRKQSLQDVPIAVSVVTGKELSEHGVRNLEDLTARIPDVKIAQTPGADQLFIRGVGSGVNLGFEQSVATFVDGVYRGRARASRLAFFDIERVEILRGPQTTFFGNNAIAGALNITTRKPGDHFEYNGHALYAPTDGEYTLEGGVSVPVTPELSVRFAGSVAGMDGYIHNRRTGGDGPDQQSQLGRFAIRWQPDSIFTVNARVDVGRVRDKGVFDAELRNCPPDPAFGAPRGACGRFIALEGDKLDDRLNYKTYVGPSQFDLDYKEAVIEASAEVADHRVTSISAYYHHNYYYYADVLPGAANASATGTLSGLPTRSAENFTQFSQELRFESVGRKPIEYMVGLYFSHNDLKAPTGSGFYFAPFGTFSGGAFAATDPIAIYFQNSERDNLMSAFASSTINFSKALRLNLGMRYSIVDKEAHRSVELGVGDNGLTQAGFTPGSAAGQAILLPITGTSVGDFANPKRSDSKFMPSANIQYDVARGVMIYASYAKGFKAGGFAVGASNATFKPETVDAYEIGIKSQLFDRRLTLNIDGFYSKYKNLQESTFYINSAGTPVSTIANAAASISKGIEAGGTLRIANNFSLTFDLAYLSSKYKNFPLAPCTSMQSFTTPNCTQDLSGKRRAFAPKWSGNVGMNYDQPIGSDYHLQLSSSVFFTSSYDEDVSRDPLLRQRGYAKIDARIGFGPEGDHWNVALIGKNLNDEATASVRRPLPSSPGSYLALPDRPRSIAIQFTIKS